MAAKPLRQLSPVRESYKARISLCHRPSIMELRVVTQMRRKAAACTNEGAKYAACVVSHAETIQKGSCSAEFLALSRCLAAH